jgi:hypothetical protein
MWIDSSTAHPFPARLGPSHGRLGWPDLSFDWSISQALDEIRGLKRTAVTSPCLPQHLRIALLVQEEPRLLDTRTHHRFSHSLCEYHPVPASTVWTDPRQAQPWPLRGREEHPPAIIALSKHQGRGWPKQTSLHQTYSGHQKLWSKPKGAPGIPPKHTQSPSRRLP